MAQSHEHDQETLDRLHVEHTPAAETESGCPACMALAATEVATDSLVEEGTWLVAEPIHDDEGTMRVWLGSNEAEVAEISHDLRTPHGWRLFHYECSRGRTGYDGPAAALEALARHEQECNGWEGATDHGSWKYPTE